MPTLGFACAPWSVRCRCSAGLSDARPLSAIGHTRSGRLVGRCDSGKAGLGLRGLGPGSLGPGSHYPKTSTGQRNVPGAPDGLPLPLVVSNLMYGAADSWPTMTHGPACLPALIGRQALCVPTQISVRRAGWRAMQCTPTLRTHAALLRDAPCSSCAALSASLEQAGEMAWCRPLHGHAP